MWLDIAKTGASLLGTIIGQQQAAKAQREANKELDKMQVQENTRYNNNLGDSMHRADVAELSKKVYDNIRSVNQQAINPMTNNTVEGANAVRQQNTEMARQTAATVNADNTKLRMENENQHAAANNAISQARAKAATAKAEQVGKATSGMVNAITGIGTAVAGKTAASSPVESPASVAPEAPTPAAPVSTPAAPVTVDNTGNASEGLNANTKGSMAPAYTKKRNLFDGIFG